MSNDHITEISDRNRKAAQMRPYEPRFDGVDGIDAAEGSSEYDGDDFTDRIDYAAETDRFVELKDVPTAIHKAMATVNACFPGDIPKMSRDGETVFAPWTAIRLQTLLGMCDAIYRQLYRCFEERPGVLKESGLMVQRDRAFEKARKLYGTRNPARLEFALERVRQLDEQIATLEEMGDAAAAVYDDAAEKADMKGMLPDWLPLVYQKPSDRKKAWAQQNLAAPMSAIEYELMCRIDGKEAADAEVKRRQEAWSAHMGAKG